VMGKWPRSGWIQPILGRAGCSRSSVGPDAVDPRSGRMQPIHG
jgi:hypothetical protein